MSYQNRYLTLLNELKTRGPEDSQHLNSRVLIIDGLNTFIRAYSASPVTNGDGEHVGGISGTLLSIGHAIKSISPTRVIVVFDGKDGSAKRRQLYPEYKANRKFKVRLNRSETVEKQDNQLEQLIRLTNYLEMLPITVIVADGTEADDTIAYIASDYLSNTSKPEGADENQVFIMSSDKDFYQLVNDQIHVWSPTKKRFYYTDDIYQEFGVHPRNFAIYRALLGDNSDNINGVDGIGDKTIQKRFPILNENRVVSLTELFEYSANQSPKIKIYNQLVESKDIIERNIQLMQLSESNINTATKLRIINMLENKVSRCNKMQFHKMLFEDKMTGAIKNVDIWLKEITTKLDQFALQS